MTERRGSLIPRLSSLLLVLLALTLSGCGHALGQRTHMPEGESPADLYVDLATEYVQRRQWEIALERAQQAVATDRRSARAHYILAIVYEQLDQREEAQRAFATAVRRAPRNPDYRNAWGAVLCAEGRHDEGLGEIAAALADPLYKGQDVALMNAADCSRMAGRDADVKRYLQQALARNPNFSPALLELAKLQYRQGDYQSARSLMARYSHTGVATPDALLLAARIERQLGNAPLARTLERTLRQRFPHSPEVIEL